MSEESKLTNVNAIELSGVSGFTDQLLDTNGRLTPFIPTNDKEPSWDGYVCVYNTTQASKKDMRCRVHVQIKAHVKNFEKNKIGASAYLKESASVADLRNYQNNGGTIYIVVYIDESNPLNRCVYYDTLTPIKINQYLNGIVGNEGTKSIRVRVFPNEANKKIDLFTNFWNDSKRQHSFAPNNFLNYDELMNKRDVANITTSVLFNKQPQSEAELVDGLFGLKEVYLYANIKGSNIPHPIDTIARIEKIVSNNNCNVSAAGTHYYSSVCVERMSDGTCLVVGGSLIYKIYNNGNLPECTIRLASNLQERRIDLVFILKALEEGCFYIDDMRMEITPNESIDDLISDLNAMSLHIEQIANVFCSLKVEEDISLNDLSDEDKRKIRLLVEYYKDQDIATDKGNNINIERWSIHDIKLLLFIRNDEDCKAIYNKLNSDNVIVHDAGANKHIVPIFTLLSVEDYATLSNIDFDDVVRAFTTNNEHIQYDSNVINIEMLKLISAYDISGDSRLLASAKAVYEHIYESAEESLKTIITINMLQITKRERELNKAEIETLLSIAEENEADDVKACVYLLVDSKVLAERHINKLDDDSKLAFSKYPIYRFMK